MLGPELSSDARLAFGSTQSGTSHCGMGEARHDPPSRQDVFRRHNGRVDELSHFFSSHSALGQDHDGGYFCMRFHFHSDSPQPTRWGSPEVPGVNPPVDELEPSWRAHFRADPLFSPAHDPAHDYLHLERVVRFAKYIGLKENADLSVVVPAAWFHDVIPIPKNDPRRKQASELCAQEAGRRLLAQGIDARTIALIQTAIREHSYSRGLTPSTLESRVVQDADRLDALGAIGVARCFSTAGSLRRAFYSEDDPFCELRAPEDALFTVDHFHAKLLKLEDTFQTQTGREIARTRTEFLREFLARLKEETSPKETDPKENRKDDLTQ